MHNKLTVVSTQRPAQRRWQFDHHRLDAYHVALQALVKGMAIINSLPRGYAKLKDQAARALQALTPALVRSTLWRSGDPAGAVDRRMLAAGWIRWIHGSAGHEAVRKSRRGGPVMWLAR